MTADILSSLSLEAFAVRHLCIDVQGEIDGDTHEAVVGLSYEFFEHEAADNKFRIKLKVGARGGEADTPLFTVDVTADAFVEVPKGASEDEKTVLLTNGVALLYSTLRGSLAGVLGQTPIRGFVLPAIDMNKVVRELAAEESENESAAAEPAAE